MKQQIVLIGLVFAMLTAFSQNNGEATTATIASTDTAKTKKEYCPHRIWVNIGAAYSNDIYRRFNKFEGELRSQKTVQNYAIGNVLEAGYTYYFHPNMGVGLGVGISRLSAKAALSTYGSTIVNEPEYNQDGVGDETYRMYYDCDDLVERQGIWAIEVPLTFQFETRLGKAQRNGIFASLGVRGYFPISSRTKFPGGSIELTGYDPYLNVWYGTDLEGHFGVGEVADKVITTKMRPSVDIAGEFGGLFGLTKKTDLYLGIYATYGFLDILPKDKIDYVEYSQGRPNINGMLNSNALETYNELYNMDVSPKWNLFQAGFKVGFRFKACGDQRAQSFREDKRDFLDKYEERLNNAAKAGRGGDDDGKKGKKGKGEGEAVYIIPIYIGNPGNNGFDRADDGIDDLEMDPEVRELVKALTNAQIYFDLDKDIPNNPKVAQREVDKAVTILKKNPNLKIILDGYTCRLGGQSHNEGLAQRRANRIRDMFIAKGVDPKQIETEAFTVANYPQEVIKSFQTLEDARTVIFKIVKQ